MALFAPGLFLVLNVPLRLGHSTSWLGALAGAALTTLFVNSVYYAAFCYGLLTTISALRRKPDLPSSKSGTRAPLAPPHTK